MKKWNRTLASKTIKEFIHQFLSLCEYYLIYLVIAIGIYVDNHILKGNTLLKFLLTHGHYALWQQ